MRRTCLHAIHDLACRDRRVVFIGSDITKRDLEQMAMEFPERFFIEGIYEAHIIGMAAGLAMCGKMPYVNTIASFLTRRCYEQILLDLGMHRLPVRLIGSGGGVVYAPLGPTHLAAEDLAILRAIPNMTIVAPCDADEMKRLMPATLTWEGPIYIRLAKGNDKIISSERHPFRIGKSIPMKEGRDVLFVTTGIATQMGFEAAEILDQEYGIGAALLHFHTVKPLDTEMLLQMARGVRVVVTAEEHMLIGGLGSAVAEVLLENGLGAHLRFGRLGFPDVFTDELGSQSDILAKYGITSAGLVKKARELLMDA